MKQTKTMTQGGLLGIGFKGSTLDSHPSPVIHILQFMMKTWRSCLEVSGSDRGRDTDSKWQSFNKKVHTCKLSLQMLLHYCSYLLTSDIFYPFFLNDPRRIQQILLWNGLVHTDHFSYFDIFSYLSHFSYFDKISLSLLHFK